MSFEKKETYQYSLQKSDIEQSPADTPRQSKDSDEPQFLLKKLSGPDDLSSGIFSQKMQSLSGGHQDFMPLPSYLNALRDNSEISEKIKTNKILNFNNFHRPKPEEMDTFEAQEKVIMHNLMVFKERRDAGLLLPRKKKAKKQRKASRVVSEGATIKSKNKQNEAEELIESDAFPSDRVGQKNQIMKFLNQNKATHSLRSSMHQLTPTFSNNKIEEHPSEKVDTIIKGLSPSEFKFETPDKKFVKNFKKPPRLTKPSWQRKARKENIRDDESFLSQPTTNENPLNWYSRMMNNNIFSGEIDARTTDLPGNAFNGNWARFEGAFPTLRENNSETLTAFTPNKIPVLQNGSGPSRLDMLLQTYRYSHALENIQEDEISEGAGPGELNPNVITFEKNPFEDIFEKSKVKLSENNLSPRVKKSEIKSRQSKSSSNENKF